MPSRTKDKEQGTKNQKTLSFVPCSLFQSIGLYVHVPFCLKKCHYCDFVITTKRAPTDRARFLNALQSEVDHAAKKYGRLKFATFYLGGGTPSALESKEFEAVRDMLFKAFDFELGFEFTVEVNPGDVDQDKVEAFRRAGVNRVSLGVQAYQEHLLKAMNRPHGTHEVEQTVNLLRHAGIHNLSMDMIIYLPNQTVADVEETLQRLIALQPNQISVYDLDVHEKTVYGAQRRQGRLSLVSEEVHAQMAEKVSNVLHATGFIQYELSNFSKPGFEAKHNLIYWNNQSYLGLGPGAFSYLDGIRYQYSDSVESYLKKIEIGDWKNQTEDRLTPAEIEKETFLTGIRLKKGIDLRRLPVLRDGILAHAQALIQAGHLEQNGEFLCLSARGKYVADSVLASFARAL